MEALPIPCGDCPFRKDSLRGWLADYTPEELQRIVLNEQPFPCHMAQQGDVDWDDAGTDENPICAGSLRFMKKSGKLPRNKELAELLKTLTLKDCESILSSQDFLDHHKPFDK